MRSRAGVVVPLARRSEVKRAVLKALDQTGFLSPAALYEHLLEREGLPRLEAFLGSLTVGETHFFRNRPQFEALEHSVLPLLIESHRGSRRLRIWSAGCSTGEETYSLAMLVHKLIPDIRRWKVSILGTDINWRAIEKARTGQYGSWSFREVPESFVSRYFTRRAEVFEVVPEIRDMVTFSYLNFVEDAYPSLQTNTVGMDLILCRNVLMYFDDTTMRMVAGRLQEALADDGWLAVAPVELSQEVFSTYESRHFPGAVLYHKVAEAPMHKLLAAAGRAEVALAANHSRAVAQAGRMGPFIGTESPGLSGPRPEPGSIETAAASGEAGMLPEAAGHERAVASFEAARALAGSLELDDAEAMVEESIRLNPLWGPAHHLKGLILLEDNRPEEALGALRRCVFADSEFVLGHFMLGSLFARLGQPARASKAFDNAVALTSGRDLDEELPEGDGLTIGRLLELIDMQTKLLTPLTTERR